MPQRRSSWRMNASFSRWYSSAHASQLARFARAWSVSPSDELIRAEPEPDLALGRLGRVGAVDEVVRHREREVAADRPRSGVGRIRRAHRRPDHADRGLALDDEGQRRRRGDELDQLAEERLLAVLGVVLLRERAVDEHELRAAQREAASLEPAEDLAGELPLDRVWLDQDEC